MLFISVYFVVLYNGYVFTECINVQNVIKISNRAVKTGKNLDVSFLAVQFRVETIHIKFNSVALLITITGTKEANFRV